MKLRMYRIAVLLSFLLLSSSVSHGQDEDSLKFGIVGEFVQIPAYGMFSFGINLNIPVADRLDVNYRLGFGGTSNGEELYIRSTLGTAAAWRCMSLLTERDSTIKIAPKTLAFGLLLWLIPEGVSYHFPWKGKSYPGIYLNPLSFDYVKNRFTKQERIAYWSGEVGARITCKFRNGIWLSPGAGLKFFYPDKEIGLAAGCTVIFGMKKE